MDKLVPMEYVPVNLVALDNTARNAVSIKNLESFHCLCEDFLNVISKMFSFTCIL